MPEIICYRYGASSVYLYATRDYAEALHHVRGEFSDLRMVPDEQIAFAVTTAYTGADGRAEYHSVRISPRVWAEVIADLKKYQFLDVFVDRSPQTSTAASNVQSVGSGGARTTQPALSYPSNYQNPASSYPSSTPSVQSPTSGYQSSTSSHQSPPSGYQGSSSSAPQTSTSYGTAGYQSNYPNTTGSGSNYPSTTGSGSNYPSTTGSGSGSSTTQSSNPSAGKGMPSSSSTTRPTR